MALVKEDFISRLDTVLQDTAEKIQPDDKLRILSQAVLIFSKDSPRELVHELTGDGSAYDFSLPDDWVDGFSAILGNIEYPADDYQDPAYIESNDWMLFKKLVDEVTTEYLRFTTFIPVSGKTARYHFIAPHTLTDDVNTIKESNTEAVVALTASLCFWALAAKFAQTTDPDIDADVIDYQRKSDIYTALAKEQFALYNSLMGLGAETKNNASAGAGTVFKDLDVIYAHGEDFLTHPARWR